MTMINGIVEEVQTKNVVTKFGEKPTWSIKVAGQWFKCGFKNPNVEVGFQVDFDSITGKYGSETSKVNILSRTVATPPASGASVIAAGAVRSSAPSYSREKVFPIPPLHGDRSIVRQNALARATELFIGACGGKAYAVDSSTCQMIIKLAKQFEAYTSGDMDLEEAEAEFADSSTKAA
jgi:hypothetical protein